MANNPQLNNHPSTASVSRKIKLLTFKGTDVNNSTSIDDDVPYIIRPVNSEIQLIAGYYADNVWILKFGNYAIKFYGPGVGYLADGTSLSYFASGTKPPLSEVKNVVYCVPSVKNSNYASGYQDYSSSIPQEFYTAFKNYVSGNVQLIKFGNRVKEYVFNYNGTITGTIPISGSFSFVFPYTVGIAEIPGTTTAGTTTRMV